MRGLAVLGIMLFHTSEMTGRLGVGALGQAAEAAGSGAVLVFFAISGFLLYRPFVAARAAGRSPPSSARYGRRRALRILPGYWSILTLLAIFPGITGVFSGDWWRYYGYLQLYSSHTLGNGIAVAWTLCVEVTFYVLLPVWAWVVRRVPARRDTGGLLSGELLPLGALGAAGLVVQVAAARHHVPYAVGVSLAGQISWIVIGMALAVLSVAARADPARMRWVEALAGHPELCWLVAALAFAGVSALEPTGGLFGLVAVLQRAQPFPSLLAKLALQGIVVTTLLLPVAFGQERQGLPRRLLAWRPLAWLGVISYSFYLWHLTVLEFIARPSSPAAFSASGLNLLAHVHFAPTLVLYVVGLAASAVLATISYRLIELPFLRLKETGKRRR